MPCNEQVIRRAKKLQIPIAEDIVKKLSHDDIIKMTGAASHDDAHRMIDEMKPEDFGEFMKKLERRYKTTRRYLETQGLVPAYAATPGVA